jgi:uncharacterized protein (DUF2225 family)
MFIGKIMEQNTPFVKRKVSCPMCEKESFQYALPPNLYSVEQKEEDQHPLKLRWYNPDFQNVKPQYYTLFHCPICFFTDFEDNYCKSQTIPNFNRLKQTFDQKNPTALSVLRFLNNKISYEDMDFESALFIHLTAIHIYELETVEQYKDYKKLSRLYHRLGWLYREQNPTKSSDENDTGIREINNNLGVFDHQYQELQKKFKPLQDSLKRRILDLNIPVDDPRNPYLEPLKSFDKNFKEIENALNKIRYVSQNDKQMISSGGQSQANLNESDLFKLSKVWNAVPLNERDSLDKAILCYEQIYQKVSASDSVSQQLGILTMLTDLCIRIDNYQKGYDYLNSLYKYCSETRQKLFMLQRQNPSSTYDGQITKLGDTMETLSDKRKFIEEKRYNFFEPQFEKIIKDNAEQSWEIIKEELLNNNIPEDIVERIQQEYVDTDDSSSKQKKKRFGIF